MLPVMTERWTARLRNGVGHRCTETFVATKGVLMLRFQNKKSREFLVVCTEKG